jgi:hypothetical protein
MVAGEAAAADKTRAGAGYQGRMDVQCLQTAELGE